MLFPAAHVEFADGAHGWCGQTVKTVRTWNQWVIHGRHLRSLMGDTPTFPDLI